jgi:hypothetical protein
MKHIYILIITIFSSTSSFAQINEDTTDGRFHDELLNHFVGKWTASGVVHGLLFNNLSIDAVWMMNHQYLQIQEKGTDTVPFIKMPWEAMFLIGYNHNSRRYVFYEFNIRGIDEPYEGFNYATRTGNKLKVSYKISSDEFINQYFIWEQASNSWHFETRLEKDGREGQPYLDLMVVLS